jgi:hypothetical protein
MNCFREQPTAEENFYTRRLQDKLRFSTLRAASRQPLRFRKPARKDFSSEQLPTPKTKTRTEWEGAVVAPHLHIRLF